MSKGYTAAEGCLVVVGGVVLVGAVSFVAPLVSLVVSGAGGYILANYFPFAADWVITGARQFGLNFHADQLPFIGAFLGFVGGFFRSSQTNKVEK